MAAGLDHLVIGGSELGLLAAWWKHESGSDAMRGGSHPGHGTRNALAGVDADTYVELIAHDPDQEEPDHPRPFGLDDLEPNSVQLCTFVLAVDDIEDAAAGVRNSGLDPGAILDMSRTRPDGITLNWRLAIPPDPSMKGTQPSLIQWGESTPHPGSSLESVVSVEELLIGLPDPEALSSALAAIGAPYMVNETPVPMLAAHLRSIEGSDFWL